MGWDAGRSCLLQRVHGGRLRVETGEMAVTYEADDLLWHLLYAVGEGGVCQGLPWPVIPFYCWGDSLRGQDTTPDCVTRAQGSRLGP